VFVSIQLTLGDATFRFLTALRLSTPTAFKKKFQVQLFVMDFIKQGRSKAHTANTKGFMKKKSVTLSNNKDTPIYVSGKIAV